MNYTFKFLQGNDLTDYVSDSFNFRQILQLDQASMNYPWSEAGWRSSFSNPLQFMLSLIINEQDLLSFALWQKRESENLELLKIVTKKDLEKRGHATYLWQETVKEFFKLKVENIFLEVEVNNLPARQFYKKMGFTQLCLRKSFYSDGADALSLKLLL